ncbi:MAG: response regulator transcription factor [Verrucomicrobia bacterium]|nr:response regulator transcription factor [Verrucomicrobiota bacterium]
MNILVVDDDPVAQRIMKMFVEKSGYTPTIYTDGPKGLEAALAPDAPPIILLDWMLPGMDGITVCKKIREAKPKVRPYVIMLSAKHGKDEIAAGLDAGADDFVSKPFNVGEMQARLRVAKRLIEYQRELLKQIDDNEVLTQRNSLLGELISKRQGVEAPKHPLPAAKPVAANKVVEHKPTDFSDHEVRYMLSIALLELRLALQGVTPRSRPPEFSFAEFCAWSGLMIPEHDAWVDLVVLGETQAAERLFESSLGRKPHSETETAGFMAEMARMVAIGFTRMLRVRAGEVVQPLISRALRLSISTPPVPTPAVNRSYDLVIENLPFRLLTALEPCTKQMMTPGAVHALDYLAGPFPPKEMSSVPIFNEGVVMTPRFIEKLLSHDVAVQQGECVAVRRPTKLARYFNA